MSFGEGFKKEYAAPKASEGEYMIRLTNIRERFSNNYTRLQFDFEYIDKVERVPNNFCLFAPNFREGEAGQRKFNIQATKIFDCFELKGDFSKENYEKWRGAVGRVKIGEDSKGFMVVKTFIPKPSDYNE